MKKKILIGIITLLIIIIAVAIGLYVGNSTVRLWTDKYILKKDIGEEDLPTIEIEEKDNIQAYAYSNYLATVGNNTLTIYNSSAKVVTSINVSITKPQFESAGRYLLVADQGGENLYLIYNDSLQWQKQMEGNISHICVNDSGAVGVIITGTTYKSVIIMYDITGKEEFKTYLSTTIATDVAISNDSKYLSFVEIKTSGTVIESKVKTISVEKAKTTPRESIIYTYTTNSNSLILKIKYKKQKVVTYCDDGIHIFENGNDEKILTIENKISFADITLDGYICSIAESEGNSILNSEYELKIQNVENKKESTYIIGSTVKNLYCNNGIIAVSLGNEVEFVNTNGWLAKKFTSIQNIKDITIGEKVAGIIYKNRIEVLTL